MTHIISFFTGIKQPKPKDKCISLGLGTALTCCEPQYSRTLNKPIVLLGIVSSNAMCYYLGSYIGKMF